MSTLESNTSKFYSSRIKTVLFSSIFFFTAYMVYAKVLSDPYGITDIGRFVMWLSVVFLCVLGAICFIKAIDLRPIVEIMPEGLLVRTFIFKETLILWHEVIHIEQEKHTTHTINMSGYVKFTTRILRIYQPTGRSLVVNLTLLNKRRNTFMDTFHHYANPTNFQIEADRVGMSDVRLLNKYQQAKRKREKVYENNFSLVGKIGSLFLTSIIMLWVFYYFSTIDVNPISIIGFVVAFMIIWFVLLVIIDSIQLFIFPLDILKERVDLQTENYLTIIRQRIKREQIGMELTDRYPLLMKDHAYYEEDGEYIYFYPINHAGQTEQTVLHKADIRIREVEEADAEAAYHVYTLKITTGVFVGEQIDEVRELLIPG